MRVLIPPITPLRLMKNLVNFGPVTSLQARLHWAGYKMELAMHF